MKQGNLGNGLFLPLMGIIREIISVILPISLKRKEYTKSCFLTEISNRSWINKNIMMAQMPNGNMVIPVQPDLGKRVAHMA